MVLDIISFIKILLSIKVMNTGGRHLYRYIAFCIAEIFTDSLALIWQFVTNNNIKSLLAILILIVYLFMAVWRMIEVTILNQYFNSLKRRKQSTKLIDIFEENMISTV